MPRPLKAKTLTRISAAREGSTYQLHVEDEAGKKALFELTFKQALQPADVLDDLLADEEEELGPKAPPSQPRVADWESRGVVKWYNATKGFGLVTREAGGEELSSIAQLLSRPGYRRSKRARAFAFRSRMARRAPRSAR